MILKHQSIALLSLTAGLTLGSAAMANTITFNGTVQASSCTPSVDGGGADATVTLDSVTMASMQSAGPSAYEKTFNFSFTGCTTTSMQKTKVHFYNATAGAVDSNGRLNMTSNDGSSNWQFELLPATGTVALQVKTTATPTNDANDLGVDTSSGAGTLSYRVRYYSLGGATAGTGTATATYLVYND